MRFQCSTRVLSEPPAVAGGFPHGPVVMFGYRDPLTTAGGTDKHRLNSTLSQAFALLGGDTRRQFLEPRIVTQSSPVWIRLKPEIILVSEFNGRFEPFQRLLFFAQDRKSVV